MSLGRKKWVLYARRLSFLKLWNAAQIFCSFYWSKWRKKPIMWGMPVSLSVEPTTACNLRCPECPSGLRSFTRPTGNLSPEVLQKLISQAKGRLSYLNFYFQGEPFIHPKFLEMVRVAREANIFTSTSTNAHFLHDQLAKRTVESGLDRLIVSIDGTDQATYEQYRKEGKLDKVIDGTKNVIKWKKELNSSTPWITFQFLVVAPNEHQIDDVKQLAEELGVDEVAYKTAQVYDYENGNPLIPKQDRYSRYKQLATGKWELKNPMKDECWKMWHSAVITWDGKVVPCCFDKDAKYVLGNINDADLKKIWSSPAYASFRKGILDHRKGIDICTNCSEGTMVWA